MAKETYKPKFEKTEANFLNEAKIEIYIIDFYHDVNL